MKKFNEVDDIGLIIDNAYEIHYIKTNINQVILVVDFIRTPDLTCIIRLVIDNVDGTSELSREYKKAIKKDIKTNKQYFLLDNIKYYLKHNII